MLARVLLLALLVPYGAWLVLAYRYHFVDGANLLFHEAGHLFFGLLGQTLGVLGGTLGQFVFPVAAAIHFLRREQRFEACICGVWAGENLMYTASYMADAQVQVLPRVGGGIHDWFWLLKRWGLLEACETLGSLTHFIGSAVVVGSLVLAARALGRAQPAREPAAPAVPR